MNVLASDSLQTLMDSEKITVTYVASMENNRPLAFRVIMQVHASLFLDIC